MWCQNQLQKKSVESLSLDPKNQSSSQHSVGKGPVERVPLTTVRHVSLRENDLSDFPSPFFQGCSKARTPSPAPRCKSQALVHTSNGRLEPLEQNSSLEAYGDGPRHNLEDGGVRTGGAKLRDEAGELKVIGTNGAREPLRHCSGQGNEGFDSDQPSRPDWKNEMKGPRPLSWAVR